MITNKIKIEMYQFCKDGDKTVYEVAEHFNLTIPTARSRCNSLNLPLKSKVKKLDETIVEFCKGGDKTLKDLAEHFNLTISAAKHKKEKLKLEFKYIPSGKVERNLEILKLVEADELTYKEIGKIFGITRQCVQGVISRYGYSRWEDRKDKFVKIGEDINRDVELGVTYKEIGDKYSKKHIKAVQRRGLISNLFVEKINNRDNEIVKQYKVNRAIDIINSNEPVLNDPNNIQTLSYVYRIASKKGYKKYPKIGRRCDGGTFEDKKILRYIQKKKDKDGWTNKRIAEKLNSLGYKTLTGKPFDWANVAYKYKAYKKNKHKRLTY